MIRNSKLTFITIFMIVFETMRSESDVHLRQLETEDFYNEPAYDNFFFVRKIQCSNVNCPPPNICIDGSVCRCAEGYANVFGSESTVQEVTNGPFCKYERKKQLTAFLLQFFIFSGAGQFYVGNLHYAIPQLIISLAPCIISCLQCCCGISFRKTGEERPCTHVIVLAINCLFSCTLCGWWLADAIIFGMNKHLDHYGVPLVAW